MTNTNHKLLVITLVGLCFLACRTAVDADEIKRRADAPKPLLPEQSIKHFRLPKDLRIELVASEPLIADPSAIAWDQHGRLFVCEMHGYNLEGHLDVQQLNKTGELDKVVRRIAASPEAKKVAEEETYGTVKLLTDTDGDGRMDHSQVWADRLPPCFGIVAARDGIIAVGRPDITFLADRDFDGKAEVRQKLFTGFEMTILERSINNPRWGLDNWVYVSAGRAGGKITGPHLKAPVILGATDFRFKPDGTAIEPVTGRNHMYGQTMTDWGDRFVTPPGLYAIPIPQHYLSRNPYVPAPDENANAANYNRLYPASQPHPWRVERSQEQEWNKYYTDRYGASESAPNGYFTAACGQLIYRADALPVHYHGNLFCCDPAQNLVHRSLLGRDGLRFEARRAPEEQESEFLTSTDQWFRPLNLATGPDGAVYVVDMYREIIEDYSAIPRYLQQQYGLLEGHSHGRLWRVMSKEASPRRGPDLAIASVPQLVDQLSAANAWWRLTAQRLLVEREDMTAIAAVRNIVRNGATPQGRLHALYVLDGLKSLEASVVKQAIADDHFAVRKHALRLSERWLDKDPALLDEVLSMAGDPDTKVRLQLALTLGESHDRRVSQTLGQLAARDGADQWMRAAILSSVVQSSHELLADILRGRGKTGESRRLLSGLASIAGARHQDKEIASLLVTIAANENMDRAEAQVACLTGLLEGLQRGQTQPIESADGKQALLRLLGAPSGDVRLLALRVAGLVKLSESPLMKAAFAGAVNEALDENQPLETRLAAIGMLASAPYEILADSVAALLDPRQPLKIQLAAIGSLSSADDPAVAAVLLSNWSAFTPSVQTAVIDAIFSRTNRLGGLLAAIQRGDVSPQSLGTLRRVQLLEHSDPKIRNRAVKLLAKQIPQNSRELVERYRVALSGNRDATRGEAVFQKVCAKCHRLGGQGSQVGPDLSAAQNRADESFLLDMLEPSAKITAGYRTYVVSDISGRVFTGVLTSETATSVTLRSAADSAATKDVRQVVEQTILRKDIELMKASDQSLMPDDLEREVSPQDMADLIAYLRKTLGPAPPAVLTLFEDDGAFITALNQGSGTATLETHDKFTGTAALRVTPLQRHSPRISGWGYRIREQPAAGEFRYIRLAWKTHGAGVMIELAAGGDWPPADSALRRYYSGENTTNWKATEVSDQAPTQWSVVTRDLWKDFGDFTLTGIAPTAMGGAALFDRIELLRSLD